jgi:hypothetical protein
VAPQGLFMTVKGVGQEVRRALVVVVHNTAQPWQTFTSDWKPKGLCRPSWRTIRQLTDRKRTLSQGSSGS